MSSPKRKREADEQEQEQEREREPRAEGKLAKRKVAVMIGYYGRGYQGSQINPNTKTIEGTLFDAFVNAGCITKLNSSHPNKVGLQRAARTDANVSATCNLISLKLILNPIQLDQAQQESDGSLPKSLLDQHSPSYYPLIKHINSFLPNHIKLWHIIRVQKSFNPRSFCDSRVYEYSLPTWLFLPPKPASPLYQRLNLSQKIPHSQDDHESNWWHLHSDLLDKDFKTIQTEKRSSYRISTTMINRIQSVLDQFKGTHNFHNLTVGKAFTERNAVRIMKDFKVTEPFLVEPSGNHHQTSPTEWISITFHGQSFMLHQIRKMIGLLVLVCRTRTPVTIVNQLYGPRKVSIPKAPGIGLILRKLNFHGYNKKINQMNQQTLARQHKKKKTANQDDDDQSTIWDSIDCDRFEALFERFKMETLSKKIFVNQIANTSDEEPSTVSATITGGNNNPDPVGLNTKQGNPAPSTHSKPPRPVRAGQDDEDEDEQDEDEDDNDVVPAEKVEEGGDPFGVWMNYLDVYTGSDLDFLNLDEDSISQINLKKTC